MLGIIGGTGFYSLGKNLGESDVLTPYGTARLQKVALLDEKMVFIPRHGERHTIPPHKINYRANVAALKKAGVTGVIAVYAAGVISKFRPGDIVLVDDFIGFWQPATFYDDFSTGIKHTDFSEPCDPEMRKRLRAIASVGKVKLKTGGIIGCTRGPRYETKGEVKALKRMGANLVNMTAGYEMALLGEAEIDFAAVAVGTNWAAGISKKPVGAEEVLGKMHGAYGQLMALIGNFAEEIV
jgi:5'-methylthioadenosine phosphorylase